MRVRLSGVLKCSFAFLSLASMKCLLFIGGECNARVESALLVQNECCQRSPSLSSVRCGMFGAFTAYFDRPLEQRVALLAV